MAPKSGERFGLCCVNMFMREHGNYRACLFLSLCLIFLISTQLKAKTTTRVYFKGTDAELEVHFINGEIPGPTLLLLGGIHGDEPGAYLAADLYADISLKKGNMIVVPRANLPSILGNVRGAARDMNRKFADRVVASDRDAAVVGAIKELMKESDFFINLHDGSGFFSPVWESTLRNPMRFGQSIIADAEEHTRADGSVLNLGSMVEQVLERVNAQIPVPEYRFRFNNHRTLEKNTLHKEQRLSATFYALTRVGIPAFGIETSKNIPDHRSRVRYQTMVVNAFLEELGIVVENPKLYLEDPKLKFLIVSINGSTPVVVKGNDVLEVRPGDRVRIVQIESNYSRGLTARIKGAAQGLNDIGREITVDQDTSIEVKKDRYLIATIPVRTGLRRSHSAAEISVKPRVEYFCVRVNSKTFIVEPGEELTVTKGDTLCILDPRTNLSRDREKAMKIDLRGFQAGGHYTGEDRGHQINTISDLQNKYATLRGSTAIFPLQAKLNNDIFAEAYVAVAEPRLEYVVLRGAGGLSFAAYSGDKLELPAGAVVRIMDVKTNNRTGAPLFVKMAGRSLKWEGSRSTGIDTSKLSETETPLDITRDGKSIGRIWLKQGNDYRLSAGSGEPYAPILRVRY